MINVENVAMLARLSLNEEEKINLAKDLENIIGFANELSKIDTDGIEPTAHIMPVQNRFRKDIAVSEFTREELLSNAPSRTNGCLSVPKVVE